MSGKNDAPINITIPAWKGRVARSTTVTVQTKNGSKPSKAIVANQAGAAVATTMDTTKPEIPKTGGTIIINGTSNSSKLAWTFGLLTNDGDILTSEEFNSMVGVKVNNLSIETGKLISNDPGASGLYNFIATAILPASPFAIDVTLVFEVTDDSGAKKRCTMNFKAGESTLSVDKTSLSFTATGGTQVVNITSNDEWSIS